MSRKFLFLQGPHGPFFSQMAEALRTKGHSVTKVGWNAGDRAFWRDADSYLPFRGTEAEWPGWVAEQLCGGVTDLVVYGDARARHLVAIQAARAGGIRVHVFEEGYLRPYWITYERDGSNGYSALCDVPLAGMEAALETAPREAPPPPLAWGQLRHHMAYGALYHWHILFRNKAYPNYISHRKRSPAKETWRHSRRLIALPLRAAQRAVATRRVLAARAPFHIALMQLDHDASFLAHSTVTCQEDFVQQVLAGFATGAPPDHRLVFKDHPLATGASSTRRMIKRQAQDHGIANRVTYVPGGKLAPLLDEASSAVTVNSTAGQQALWRGLPLWAMGRAVYGRPGFTSQQTLAEFFAKPEAPDRAAYDVYRDFLLRTSQVAGGYYSARARARAVSGALPLMLRPTGPYETGSDATGG